MQSFNHDRNPSTPATRRGDTSRVSRVSRVTAGAIAAGAVVGLFVGTGSAGAVSEPHKSYVCKYVTTPGEGEILQTGQNPIFVDNNALLGYDGTVTVGQSFSDKQGRSVVIVANTDKLTPEPSVEQCPAVAPPTTTTTTTSTTTTTAPVTSTSTTTAPVIVTSTTTAPVTSTSTTRAPAVVTSTTTAPSVPVTVATPAPTASSYALQPVKAGAAADAATTVAAAQATNTDSAATRWRTAGLLVLAMLGTWVAFGARRPRISRVGSKRDDS